MANFDPAIVFILYIFLGRPLVCRALLALVFSDCQYPSFQNFCSVIPFYVVRVESYVNCIFRFPSIPVFFSVNKLHFFP